MRRQSVLLAMLLVFVLSAVGCVGFVSSYPYPSSYSYRYYDEPIYVQDYGYVYDFRYNGYLAPHRQHWFGNYGDYGAPWGHGQYEGPHGQHRWFPFGQHEGHGNWWPRRDRDKQDNGNYHFDRR